MLKAKTHFEQVPLDTVRKMVEQQIRLEITIEQEQGTKNNTLAEDLLAVQEQSMARPCTFSREVIEAIHESAQQKLEEHIQKNGRIRRPGLFGFGWSGEKN
jgi:hypothetical protein